MQINSSSLFSSRRYPVTRGMGGFSLVELMVAMVLGLLLVLAATNLYLTNKQTYRTVENLSRLQESLRFAFDLMGRDARMAGAIPCGPVDTVANLGDWGEASVKGIAGATGSGADIDFLGAAIAHCDTTPSAGCRVDNTAALQLANGVGTAESLKKVINHDSAASPPTVTLDDVAGISVGDTLMVCKPGSAAVFGVTEVVAADDRIKYPAASLSTDRTNDLISSPVRQLWYIGNNGRGGTSLYRKENNGAKEEIVPGVTDMELAFLTQDGTEYQGIGAITDWGDVRAIQVTLTVESPDEVGSDGNPLTRNYTFAVSLRNRLK